MERDRGGTNREEETDRRDIQETEGQRQKGTARGEETERRDRGEEK
jgi:hypothetical protein